VATVDGTSGGSPLVGRAAERATVHALADAKGRQGGSFVLAGPAGIGKSAADIVHASTAPVLVVPAQAVES
jgi:hypothetical protein